MSILFAIAIGVHHYGDVSSYYLMVNSLIKDGDFILDNKDVARWQDVNIRHGAYVLPAGAYVLIDKDGVIRYGKPILYPLIAAPFFLFFGRVGFGILNGLFLGGSIALCYLFLKRHFNSSNSLIIGVMFFLCSFMPVYVAWIHPEMMLFFACSLCMWLWLYKNKTTLTGLIIGICSSVKIVFLLLLLPLIVVLISKKKFKQSGKAIGASLLGIGLMLFLTYLFFGQIFAYIGTGSYGYLSPNLTPYLTVEQVRNGLVAGGLPFEEIGFNSLGLFSRNIFNFFMGRFTGIIWYALSAVICVGTYLLYRRNIKREEKILGDSILAVTLLLAVILIASRPLNYFGGRGFICNRYFFILPALLYLPTIKMVKNPKKIILMFLPGFLISSQIIINEFYFNSWSMRNWANRQVSPHGAHACTFPLRYAPLEITAIESFPVSYAKTSDNIFLYFPSGLRRKLGKKILMDKEQEVVIVQKNNTNILKFDTDKGRMLLKPEVTLKDKINKQYKSFYYFRADQPIWINDVHS